MRLVKYTVGQTVVSLATTLLDAALYRGPDLARLYHGRWSLEEYCKTSKTMLVVEQFRNRSKRLVRQELYAHFTLPAVSRLFANHSEESFREGPDGIARTTGSRCPARTDGGGNATCAEPQTPAEEITELPRRVERGPADCRASHRSPSVDVISGSRRMAWSRSARASSCRPSSDFARLRFR